MLEVVTNAISVWNVKLCAFLRKLLFRFSSLVFLGDPRVVANLVDGCYLTRDDMHLWLAPYTTDGDHLVAIEFEEEVTISMIRVWVSVKKFGRCLLSQTSEGLKSSRQRAFKILVKIGLRFESSQDRNAFSMSKVSINSS